MTQQRWWLPQNLPPQVVKIPKHTPQSPLCPTSAQSIGSEGSKLEARGGTLGPTEGPNRGSGHPKTCCHRWWTPQNIPLNLHYNLPLLSTLGVRGVSLPATKVMGIPKHSPTCGGTPKHTPRSPLLLPLFGPLEVTGVRWEQGE